MRSARLVVVGKAVCPDGGLRMALEQLVSRAAENQGLARNCREQRSRSSKPFHRDLISVDIQRCVGDAVRESSRGHRRRDRPIVSRSRAPCQVGRPWAGSQLATAWLRASLCHSWAISGLKRAINASSGFPRSRGGRAAAFQEASAAAGCFAGARRRASRGRRRLLFRMDEPDNGMSPSSATAALTSCQSVPSNTSATAANMADGQYHADRECRSTVRLRGSSSSFTDP